MTNVRTLFFGNAQTFDDYIDNPRLRPRGKSESAAERYVEIAVWNKKAQLSFRHVIGGDYTVTSASFVGRVTLRRK
jgi:hypothetical protein